MTNELEKQFFQCFGIEPRYEDACTVEDKYWNNEELANEFGTFDQYMNCKCGNQENCTTECSCAYQREVYPTISDHILLQLICFNNSHYVTLEDLICPKNIETIKESVLRKYIERNKEFVDNGYSGFGLDKVRTLFEEG